MKKDEEDEVEDEHDEGDDENEKEKGRKSVSNGNIFVKKARNN